LDPSATDYPAKPHDPGFGMWAAPALLAVLVVLIGIMPALMVGPLVATVARP
jgi:multicomponent K+:H+ antiporter subunit A